MTAPQNAWSSPRLRNAICLATIGLLSLPSLLPSSVQAADITPQQQEVIDKLMEALTKSKVNNNALDKLPTNARQSDNKEIVLTRQMLIQVSREADILVNELRNSLYAGIPGMSQVFGQTLTLKSDLKVLTDRANMVHDHRELMDDLKNLDKDWRALAYQLSQMRDISTQAKRSVQIINDYATQISQALNVAPQLDRKEMQRQAYILEEQLRNLNNDILFELGHTQKITELTKMGGTVRSDAQRLSDQIAAGNSYDEIVLSYKSFSSLWRNFVQQLHAFDNRYIERDIMAVYKTDSSINELLWIPKQADWAQLTELAHILHRDVRDLFDSITLTELMTLSKSQEAIKTGRIYRDLCDSFKRLISEQRPENVLSNEFQKLDNAWKVFATDMIELKGTETWNRMKQINNSIVSLRSALLIKPANYDNDSLVESASELESMAEHLQFDMQRWLNSSAGSAVPGRRDYLTDTTQFVTLSRDFHQKLSNGYTDQNALKSTSTALLSRWLKLLTGIGQCTTSDRDHLNQLSQEITAELVKIQSQLTL
ncbi:hypothetical protein Pla110_16380 [Polystyrenella longa]|uniref:Chromosome partition protein Smc n=1 Tax=Polystyrenella longa TaxID=2528007 RepID=A0A518CL12_9PLAN|nr:hypothetical protein [Polystyrenella longa]QDU79918.1 hypothetical protein Pla110_16380 [Polystyrenella longa]